MRGIQTAIGVATTLVGVITMPALGVKYAGLGESAVAMPNTIGIPLVLAVTALPAILGGLLAIGMARGLWIPLVLLFIPLNLVSLVAAAVLVLGLGPLPFLPALVLLAATIVVGIGMEQRHWQT